MKITKMSNTINYNVKWLGCALIYDRSCIYPFAIIFSVAIKVYILISQKYRQIFNLKMCIDDFILYHAV